MKKISIIALAVASVVSSISAFAGDEGSKVTHKAATHQTNHKMHHETAKVTHKPTHHAMSSKKPMIEESDKSNCAENNNSFYIRLNSGYGFIPGDVKADFYFLPFVTASTATNTPAMPQLSKLKIGDSSSGAFIAPAIGMNLGNGFRTDLEMYYYYSNTKKYTPKINIPMHTFSVSSPAAANNIAPTIFLKKESWSALINGFYDFKIDDSKVIPFLGIGIGFGQTKYSISNLSLPDSANGILDNPSYYIDSAFTEAATKKTRNSFIWGGNLGLAYKLSCNSRIEIAYNIQAIARTETKAPAQITPFGAVTAPDQTLTARFKGDNLMHSIKVGVMMSF